MRTSPLTTNNYCDLESKTSAEKQSALNPFKTINPLNLPAAKFSQTKKNLQMFNCGYYKKI